MSVHHGPGLAEAPPLDVAQLALRWGLTEKEVHRRLRQIHLPSINVGTVKDPKLRFRLATVISWEIANEFDRNEVPAVPEAATATGNVPAGAYPAWDGVRRTARTKGGPRK